MNKKKYNDTERVLSVFDEHLYMYTSRTIKPSDLSRLCNKKICPIGVFGCPFANRKTGELVIPCDKITYDMWEEFFSLKFHCELSGAEPPKNGVELWLKY